MNLQDLSRPFKPGDVSEDEVKAELVLMENNPELDTPASLAKGDDLPDYLISFQEKHIKYLREHPKVNPAPYLANLKTMIKIRK
jgi:hypothetical protein